MTAALVVGLAAPADALPAPDPDPTYGPSDQCRAMYDDGWCERLADQYVDLNPGTEYLVVEEVGGFEAGDEVPIVGRAPAVIDHGDDVEMLRAIVRHVVPGRWRWAVLTIAGESEMDRYADNPISTALGYGQFLDDWYDGAYPGDPFDPDWQARAIQYLLDHGGPSHWQYKAPA